MSLPVALAAITASSIAKSEPIQTGIQASRLAVVAFIIPYIFVYSPSLLLINVTPLKLIFVISTALVGVLAIASGLTGFFMSTMNIFERALFLVGGVMLVTTNYTVNIIAVVLIAVGYFLQKRKSLKINIIA